MCTAAQKASRQNTTTSNKAHDQTRLLPHGTGIHRMRTQTSGNSAASGKLVLFNDELSVGLQH